MISWAFRDDGKIKNGIRMVKPVKTGKGLYFIFDICDEFDDLYFNYALSLEPRLAFTFFSAKKVNKKTPNPKNSLLHFHSFSIF